MLGAGDCPHTEAMPVALCLYGDGTPFIESCWRLSWRERLLVALTGHVYVQVMGMRVPPLHVSARGDAPAWKPEGRPDQELDEGGC